MHDPSTVAFDIKVPWKCGSEPFRYRPTLITIWHDDPQSDGTDDSCGWFMRSRHGDPEVYKRIKGDFEFNWDADYGGWFNKDGRPQFSTPGIVLGMFYSAAFFHFGQSRRRAASFVQAHLSEILHFAENPTDSASSLIVGKYGMEPRADRISSAASMIYGCVLRWHRPWYKHPRWHFWHWRVQVIPLQRLRRWLFTRCSACGKRFAYGEAPISHSWDRDRPGWFKSEAGLYHANADCSGIAAAEVERPPQ